MTISAELRHDKKSKELRETGRVPGVLYGKNVSPISIDLDAVELRKEMENSSGLLEVKVDGKPYRVLVRQLQKNPIKDEWIHIDLFAVSMKEDIDVEVPIHLVGESVGVKDGGVLQHVTHEVIVRCKPDQIPSDIPVDISELRIGDSITLRDIASKLSFEVITDSDTVLVTVRRPAVEDDDTSEDAGEGAEEPTAEE